MDNRPSVVPAADNLLLTGLSPSLQAKLADCLPVKVFSEDQILFREGDVADHIGLVIEGTLAVSKGLGESETRMAMMEPGDWYGGASFSTGIRSATVTAMTSTRVAILKAEDIWTVLGEQAGLAAIQQFFRNVMMEQNASLKSSEEMLMSRVRQKLRSGRAVAILISLMSIYCYFLCSFPGVSGRTMESLSLTIAGLAAGGGLLFMWYSRLPLSVFGLQRENLWSSIRAALIWSVVTCAVLTGLKAVLPFWSSMQLMTMPSLDQAAVLWLGVYFISAVVQEFASRSFLHTIFEQFFEGALRDIRAVMMSNLVFSVFHLHYSPKFALMGFIIGLLYGAFWVRHRNLLAVTLFHWITGVWALDVLTLLALPGM